MMYYQEKENKWTPPKIRKFDLSASAGSLYSCSIVLDDFSTKLAAFEKQGTRFLFDWESWVGYSEWFWRSFLRNKPGRPFVVRVILSKCAYYNYQFKDDQEWTCFRLESPDHKHVVYGYAERNSPLPVELTRLGPEKKASGATIRVKCRPGEKQKNQLQITELIVGGWVVTGEQLERKPKQVKGEDKVQGKG
ncbi:MAG: hypothetical protein ACKJSK_12940 [Roseibacillus sp.]